MAEAGAAWTSRPSAGGGAGARKPKAHHAASKEEAAVEARIRAFCAANPTMKAMDAEMTVTGIEGAWRPAALDHRATNGREPPEFVARISNPDTVNAFQV